MSLQKSESTFQVEGWEHAPMSMKGARQAFERELHRMVKYGRPADEPLKALRALQRFTSLLGEGRMKQYPHGMPPESVNAIRATLELIRIEAANIERCVNREEEDFHDYTRDLRLCEEAEREGFRR